jgi:hypothetical protein
VPLCVFVVRLMCVCEREIWDEVKATERSLSVCVLSDAQGRACVLSMRSFPSTVLTHTQTHFYAQCLFPVVAKSRPFNQTDQPCVTQGWPKVNF